MKSELLFLLFTMILSGQSTNSQNQSKNFNLALIQMKAISGDSNANLNYALEMIEAAASNNEDVIFYVDVVSVSRPALGSEWLGYWNK